MLAAHYCVQVQKNIGNKQTELTQLIKNQKKTNQIQINIKLILHISIYKILITIKQQIR